LTRRLDYRFGENYPNCTYTNYYPYDASICTQICQYYNNTNYCDGPCSCSDPAFAVGSYPYTSPVGSFSSNGYGLFDMAGNISSWCWDWYGNAYYTGGQIDPQGP